MYIFWFLHQTTTVEAFKNDSKGCISFDSYIKPQLEYWTKEICMVVYLLIPTSNHNVHWEDKPSGLLYIFWFLHQTTTGRVTLIICHLLYIFWFLHQTTTYISVASGRAELYIFWFLHQTTTCLLIISTVFCCISFDSYIKPQRITWSITKRISCISFDSYIKPQLLRYLFMTRICCISFDSYIKPQPYWRWTH